MGFLQSLRGPREQISVLYLLPMLFTHFFDVFNAASINSVILRARTSGMPLGAINPENVPNNRFLLVLPANALEGDRSVPIHLRLVCGTESAVSMDTELATLT